MSTDVIIGIAVTCPAAARLPVVPDDHVGAHADQPTSTLLDVPLRRIARSRYLVISALARARLAIHPRQRLQELPSDHAVRLDQWPEVPEGDAVAAQLAGGGDRRQPRALVDQGDLAEVVARPHRSPPARPSPRPGRFAA